MKGAKTEERPELINFPSHILLLTVADNKF